ncbi:RNA-binding with serine-rich domain-containing protein [Fusarium coicis]|nr:RNA-binding with serine-rich domain-containing protein [Fusarium coicis]
MQKPSFRHIPRFKPIPSTPTRDIEHNFELRPPLPQWLRDRHLAAVTGRARAHLLHALNVLVHPSAAIITTRGHLPAPHHLSVVMAVTDLAAALGAVATVGVEAAVVAGAAGPAIAMTEIGIVVERLSKNINEQHLHEIFGQFGRIKDLDLPINRTFGTNRGTAYILYDYEDDAEAAIAHMHEAQVDGSAINVSIVLPRRKLSPAPPTARRGANIDPRVPFAGARGGPPGAGIGGNNGMGGGGGGGSGGGRRRASPGNHARDLQVPGEKQPAATMVTR